MNAVVSCARTNLSTYPVGGSAEQVGDDSGTLQCFEVKHGLAKCVFSYRFAEGGGCTGGGGIEASAMIRSVTMGGVESRSGGGDRIFATQVQP